MVEVEAQDLMERDEALQRPQNHMTLCTNSHRKITLIQPGDWVY